MPIDVCKLFGSDTVFLQQAAHLTGGSYLYLEQKEALLQYLIVSLPLFILFRAYSFKPKMTFLPPPKLRRFVATPTQDRVDFRAACFCHKKIVDVGFVCSVCLSSESNFFSKNKIKLAFRRVDFVIFFPLSPPVFCQPIPVCSTCR